MKIKGSHHLLAAIVLTSTACTAGRHPHPGFVLFSENRQLLLRITCPASSGPACASTDRIDARDYIELHYQKYRNSGYLDLDQNMNLHLVAPIMRAGTDDTDAGTTGVGESAQGGTLTAHFSNNLLGYETMNYSVEPTAAGGVALRLISTDLKGVSVPETQLRATDYLAMQPSSGFLRLFFQLRQSNSDHNPAILIASSHALIEETSRMMEQDPDSICGTNPHPPPDVHCVVLRHGVALRPELKVYVRGRAVSIPMGGRLAEAFHVDNMAAPEMILPKLTLHRQLGTAMLPVFFRKDSQDVLDLPLQGGDRIDW